MNTQKNKAKIIKELLHSTDKELTDEELMSEILSTNVSENSEKNEREDKITFGQKAADGVARFAGSWAFIFSFIAVMAVWMVLNVCLAAKGIRRISVYSFESGSVLYRRGTGALDYDEPEPSGGEGQKARRKRLSRKFKKRICNRRTV